MPILVWLCLICAHTFSSAVRDTYYRAVAMVPLRATLDALTEADSRWGPWARRAYRVVDSAWRQVTSREGTEVLASFGIRASDLPDYRMEQMTRFGYSTCYLTKSLNAEYGARKGARKGTLVSMLTFGHRQPKLAAFWRLRMWNSLTKWSRSSTCAALKCRPLGCAPPSARTADDHTHTHAQRN